MTPPLDTLAQALPPGAVLTEPADLANYQYDRGLDPDAAPPLAVVLATSTADVQAAVSWAAQHQVPVVPRGAGTGLSGGASALARGIVVCTEQMREVTIDTQTLTAVVQPGLLNAELKHAVAEKGLWYPPDPASFEICSIGGNVATNAGGLCCVKYGVTADYVLGMEVVLADGRAIRLGGPRLKDVAGLSLTQLFVGSEGTLGIITEVTVRLLPPPPPSRTVIGYFSSTAEASAAIAQIASTSRPAMLEYMDALSINAVADAYGVDLDREAAALVLACSDDQHPQGPEVALILQAFSTHGAYRQFEAQDSAQAQQYIAARRAAIPAVEHLGTLLLEDVGVAVPRLPDLITGVEQIAANRGVQIAFIAHAGDGNTHPLIVFDPADDQMRERAHLAYGEVMDLALKLGGTITGEHGVGRLKRPWLEQQIGADALEISRRIKDALDPAGILNPGSVFTAVRKDSHE